MTTDLLNPCNDYVFQRLFAASPTLLADLINAVRNDEPPIEVVAGFTEASGSGLATPHFRGRTEAGP